METPALPKILRERENISYLTFKLVLTFLKFLN